MINTVNLTTEEKKIKKEELRKFQQPLLDAIGDPNGLYIPKMAYVPRNKSEKHISFFISELNNKQDIYTEFVSKNYDSEDPDRILYKWKYNPHYKEEYDTTEASQNGNLMYLIPIAELIKITNITRKPIRTVDEPDPKESKAEDLNFVEETLPEDAFTTLDENVKHMTIKDFAAILWKRPVSEKQWLNELINQTNK